MAESKPKLLQVRITDRLLDQDRANGDAPRLAEVVDPTTGEVVGVLAATGWKYEVAGVSDIGVVTLSLVGANASVVTHDPLS